nr:enoyl-CoA hydratase [Gammaproteobacteria bacterium]
MASDLILLEVENGIAWVTLNRPQALNALSPELLRHLLAAIEMLGEDDEVEAVVLMGAGDRAFSAGADIKVLNASSPGEVRDYAQLAIAITRKIETLGKISIAAIDGIAAGGGLEIAEACMIRIATKGSRLGHPEVHIAAVAGWGGMTRLPRLIGRGRAAELLLTGEMIDADKALEYGVVSRVVERD